jgi:hypothetical protein
MSGTGVSLRLESQLKRLDCCLHFAIVRQLHASPACCLRLSLAASALSICACLSLTQCYLPGKLSLLTGQLDPMGRARTQKDGFYWYCLECFFYLLLWSASFTFPGV